MGIFDKYVNSVLICRSPGEWRMEVVATVMVDSLGLSEIFENSSQFVIIVLIIVIIVVIIVMLMSVVMMIIRMMMIGKKVFY